MIFLSQAQIDALLLEDIQGGDLTTRALNIGHQPGYIAFFTVRAAASAAFLSRVRC
ncbi:putative pyrophosphorylase modD domain protein [Shigella flexneri 1235-66]|nr:putative pyrophosphorylase modD domain protein [Shigella flexneri 1235-66]